MSDKILEALVQLFAIVVSVRGAKDMSERRMVVYNFLATQLNVEMANKYIAKFDDYYSTNIRLVQRSDSQYKTISRVASNIMRIAFKLNMEMSLYQKYIVLVQLYEYLNTGQVSYVELGLVHDVVAEKFNISSDEFDLIRSFVLDTLNVPERIVFSGREGCESFMDPRHVFWEDLESEIHFVYLPVVNIFLFKCFGNQQIDMNGVELVPGRTYVMHAGSSLRNGVSSPIFFYDMMRQIVASSEEEPITIEARNVVYRFSNKTIGIQKLSFESHSGRMVGIMGVSGSGKSTFANIISGMARPSSGNVYINNIDIYEHPEEIEGLIGFVTQDDILIEDLTVYENLYYSSLMSFDNLPIRVIEERIEKLLCQLGLSDVRDLKVGSPLNKKISGGQRKRLNIALELIREPAILILDEPTSGLSSHDSQTIIELLKDLSIHGKLIFVIIHQPSSDIFKMFDQLLILDIGGYLIYDGNPVESLSYFRLNLHMVSSREVECRRCGNINVEQVLDIISQTTVDEYGNSTQVRKVKPEEWYEKFSWGAIDTTYVGDPEPLPAISFKTPNRLKQVRIYLQRDLRSKMANLQYILINSLETPAMAVFVGLLLRYYNISSNNGYIFADNVNLPVYLIVSVIIAFFVGLTVSAEEIIQDRQVLKRERFLNLSRRSYILSKCVFSLVLSAFQMLFYVLIGNAIMGIKGMLWEYWLVLFSTAVSANMVGLNLSDMMKKTVNIYIIIPFMVIPQLILSGVFVRFDKMNPDVSPISGVPTIGQAIVARWAYEALVVNQFCNNDYESMFFPYEKMKRRCTYYKDYWVPTLSSNINKALKLTENRVSEQNEIQRILNLVETEINYNARFFPDIEVPRSEMFKSGLFGLAAYNVVNKYLNDVRSYNINAYNRADISLDRFRRRYSGEELDSLRSNYHNASITEFVTNTAGVRNDVIMEHNGRLLHRIDHIYQDTDDAFLAPLFTSYKKFLGREIDTFYFDVIVIWFINLVTFLILFNGRLGAWLRR